MTQALTDVLHPRTRRPLSPEARQRQREGQYKGLLHAVQKRKADYSANYATNFEHGQMALDFERSAEAAGETREDVRNHFALLDRGLLMLCGFFTRIVAALPQLPLRSDATSPRAPKLVRALALLLWRPLRLYRTQEHWEQLALYYRLQQLARWRQKYGDLTVERFEAFRECVQAVVDNWDYAIDRRLKRIEKRFWKVWRLYRALVGIVGLAFGARDSGLRAGDPELPIADCRLPIEKETRFSKAATEDQPLPSDSELPIADSRLPVEEGRGFNQQSAIENRQCRIQFRGKPHYDQFHPPWPERIDDLTAEAIADPFQSPSHALRSQQKRSEPVSVKGPEHWKAHPPNPCLPESEFPDLPASHLGRDPSEGELLRMVRKGELVVPGSFEEFAELVEAALGPQPRDSGTEAPIGTRESQTANSESPITNPESRAYLHALAESLWNRMHVFSTKTAELRELLEATLVWEPNRFLPLWKKLLPPEYGYDAVSFFQRTHGPHREEIAWGDDETTLPWHECKPRPPEVLHSEADGRKKQAGELQHALRIWVHAVWHALVPVLRGSHKVTVALYDWAVSRFGIREEFLRWRPNLSLAQLDTRSDRPEWAVRVVTVSGKALVKLSDGRVFEPDSA